MQGDGNLVLYHGSTALWSSGTNDDNGASVTMQGDGNLVVYYNGVAKWSSNTSGFQGAFLDLQNDSNLVIYQGSHPVWDWGSGYLGDRLTAGITVTTGEELFSSNHQYRLIMQGDGNLVLYHGSTALWSSGTAGDSGASVTMQGDGNLVVYYNGVAKWNSNTAGFQGASLDLQNDDNLVLYQGSHPLWDWSAGYLGNKLTAGITLTPGEELFSPNHDYRLIMQGDGNLVLYKGGTALWWSGTSGSGLSVTMQGDGNLVVYANGVAKWSSGTAGFSGSFLDLQNDSNLVIYQGGTAIWDWESGRISGGGGGSSRGQEILREAKTWEGTPYCFAGGEPSGPSHGDGNVEGATQCPGTTKGFDCTGLTLYAVYQVSGKVLAHNGEQAVNAVSQGGEHIYSKAELEPGDLVYFGGSFGDFDHVGVYAGGGMMWDANIAFWIYPDGVHERSLASIETEDAFVGAVRF